MARTNNLTNFLTDVAGAIRNKKGTIEPIACGDFDTEINTISTVNNQDKTITTNGTYTADVGYTGLGNVTVNVPSGEVNLQEKNITITENGTTSIVADENYDGLSEVNITTNVSGGGTSASEKDINFYDYDGTIVASYSLNELPLVELPQAPTHTGLVFQGWNWSLEDINNLDRAMNIGAMYVTDDGKTRLYLEYPSDYERLDVAIRIEPTVANGVIINWGDGESTTTTSTRLTQYTHTYEEVRNYVISIECTSGTYKIGGSNSSTTGFGTAIYNRTCLKKVELGNSVTCIGTYVFQNCYSLTSVTIPNGVTSIGVGAFNYCYSLTSITIPNSVTSIGTYVFQNCYSLTSVTIPNGVTSIGNGAFNYCYSLTSVTIPNSVTSIGNYVFQNCYSLTSVTIPNSVTSIGTYVFQNCYSLTSVTIPNGVTSIGGSAFGGCTGMKSYYFKDFTSVPTLANTNAFSGIPSDCKIYVPADLLDDWKAATNWSNYASYIEALPEEE